MPAEDGGERDAASYPLRCQRADGVVRLRVCPRVFFFQAEDGIRDDLVTGVQTCALPIYGEEIGPAYVGWPMIDGRPGRFSGLPVSLDVVILLVLPVHRESTRLNSTHQLISYALSFLR